MLKAIMFAAALATAGAGAVYAQTSGGGMTGGSPGTMGTERGTGGSMGTQGGRGTMGQQGANGAQILTTLPQHATAVSNWYDQNVYDQQDSKIGEVKDMLLDQQGKVQAVIISVGGFLGMGEKDVAVAFNAVNPTQRDNRWRLTMNANKEELRTAPGFRFDRSKQQWTVASND